MQNLKMNKKGLGEIVAVVTLVLITTVAALIVSSYVSKLVNPEMSLAPQYSCIEMQTALDFGIRDACYNSATGKIEVALKREISSLEFNSLEFTINSPTESSSWSCGAECGNCVIQDIGDVKKYYFAPENSGEQNKVILRVGSCVLDEREIRACE